MSKPYADKMFDLISGAGAAGISVEDVASKLKKSVSQIKKTKYNLCVNRGVDIKLLEGVFYVNGKNNTSIVKRDYIRLEDDERSLYDAISAVSDPVIKKQALDFAYAASKNNALAWALVNVSKRNQSIQQKYAKENL